MTNLDAVINQLREERGEAQLQVRKLEDAISTLEGLVGAAQDSMRRTRTVSAAARRRMAQAQKARWAKWRAKTSPAKRTLSIAGRRRIAAAQRARWAAVKAKEKRAA